MRLYEGEPEQARKVLLEALKLAKDRGDKRVAAECAAGSRRRERGRATRETAAQLFAAADTMLESMGATASAAERLLGEAFATPLRARLGEDAWESQTAAGSRLSAEEAIALAQSLAA